MAVGEKGCIYYCQWAAITGVCKHKISGFRSEFSTRASYFAVVHWHIEERVEKIERLLPANSSSDDTGVDNSVQLLRMTYRNLRTAPWQYCGRRYCGKKKGGL